MPCAEHDSCKAQTADTEFERGLINNLRKKKKYLNSKMLMRE